VNIHIIRYIVVFELNTIEALTYGLSLILFSFFLVKRTVDSFTS